MGRAQRKTLNLLVLQNRIRKIKEVWVKLSLVIWMPTREEMVKEVVDDYNSEHTEHFHDKSEFQMRLEAYNDIKDIKNLLQKIVDKQG